MKKILFVVVAIVALTFASCGNKTVKNEATTDSTTVVADSTSVDSTATVDSATVK